MRLLKKSGLTAFIVFAIAFALVPVFGMRAHAGKTVARVVHQRWGDRSTPYKSLQSALDAVKNDERILLLKDVTARNGEGYRVTGGKSFILDLCGHSITTSSESIACNALHIDNAGGELIISDSIYIRCGSIQVDPSMQLHGNGIRLDAGRLILHDGINYRGARSINVLGGELIIGNGHFHNPIVILNSRARVVIEGGELEPPRGSLRAKGKNACNMTISGGNFFGKVTNTGKTGFITGGTFYHVYKTAAKYIHPDYHLVKTTMSKQGKSLMAYRVEKRPASAEGTDTADASDNASELRQRVEEYRDKHED